MSEIVDELDNVIVITENNLTVIKKYLIEKRLLRLRLRYLNTTVCLILRLNS